MKLSILFSSFRMNQLNEVCLSAIQETARSCFMQAYGIKQTDLQIEFGEAKAAKYDIVLAFDAYPSIGSNPIQKRDVFRDMLAQKLYSVIPSACCYGGRILVCLENSIKKAEPSVPVPQEPTAHQEYELLSREFIAESPRFTFERLVLSDDVRQRILEQICILENRDKLFNQWGLAAIASPSVLLNLYGDSGTGKSMAAEAIASRLGKKILRVSYADIESKYHGEGPKRLKGIFLAAARQDAVLFIDEADSLLSARLNNVTQGSEQAINSMRSQLLISLENHDGIVIFATNLIENYDKAFKTRLLSVEMKRPDAALRKKIWHNHLYPVGETGIRLNIPLAQDIDLEQLSDFDFCGRDIRNAVKQACISVVSQGRELVCQQDLMNACQRIQDELEALALASKKQPSVRPVPSAQQEALVRRVKEKLSSDKTGGTDHD